MTGLSHTVVSSVLRKSANYKRFSQSTIDLVNQTAAALNYRPNTSARSMRLGKHLRLGLVFNHFLQDNFIFSELLRGLEAACLPAMYQISVIWPKAESFECAANLIKLLQPYPLDAVVIFSDKKLPQEFISSVRDIGVEVVVANGHQAYDNVTVDDLTIGRIQTRYLIDCGCRKILYLKGYATTGHHSAGLRLKGYKEVMAENKLPPEIAELKDSHGRESIDKILKLPIDGIVAYDDHVALCAQKSLLKAGLLGNNFFICGCNNGEIAKLSVIPLTTIHIPWFELGFQCGETALAKASSPGKKIPVIRLPAHLAPTIPGHM